MTTIYLVRHGQTEFNVQGRMQGWADSPLTPAGKLQAGYLRSWFTAQNIHFEAAYSSDLGRAIETMRLLAPQDIQQFVTPGLREISYGKLDGQPASAMDGIDWDEEFEAYGGESYEQCIIRAYRCLLQIAAQDSRSPLLAVSHGAILFGLYMILPKAEGLPQPEEAVMTNGTVMKIELEGQQALITDLFTPQI